jgi:hypothetical protein
MSTRSFSSTLSTVVLLAAALSGCGTRVTTATAVAPAPNAPATTTSFVLESVDQEMGLTRDPAIAAAIADIDPQHIRQTDSALVSFGTRNTFSDTLSTTRGIGAARRWLYAQLEQYSRECGGCLRVEYYGKVWPLRRIVGTDTMERPVNIVDVVAWLPGRDLTHVTVITGHYDSCICAAEAGGSFDSTATAPGADDDGSGSSAVVELARVMSKHFPKGLASTMIFSTVAAEEQGLYGGRELAERLHEEGYKVTAGMTDDIVGNVVAEDGTTDSTSFRVFAADPDNSPSRELGRYAWALNEVYMPSFQILPVWRLDRIQRGGDHEPYVNLGDAGLRFTERVENYNRQHLPTDVFAHVNFGYVANIARMNAVVVGSLASAPATPANARATRQGRAGAAPGGGAAEASATGGQAWTLSWQPSPGAESYEVLVRTTTSPTWEQVIPVGSVTSCTLKRQLDDEWAGVRAVGPTGARSMAASMPAPPPPPGARGAGRGGAGRGAGRGAAPAGAAAGRGAGRGPAGPPPPVCGPA